MNLAHIQMLKAKQGNYNGTNRSLKSIKYIVMHYTGNVGDTAYNNVAYFHNTLTKSSAHFFVSDNDIWQSVEVTNAAYAVGLGAMTGPYKGTNPTHYGICTNTNSVSIEMCGSATSREASSKTKQTACELAVTLLKELNLTPSCVIRHYDVTGKSCPAWAVEDPAKWLEIQTEINKLYYGDDDEMKDTQENYEVFKKFQERYETEKSKQEQAWSAAAMAWAKSIGLIDDGRPASSLTRGEMATILQRFEKHVKGA